MAARKEKAPYYEQVAGRLIEQLEELRAEVQQGLSDIVAGRIHDFDPERIIRNGEQQCQ